MIFSNERETKIIFFSFENHKDIWELRNEYR